ncbi:hypothetical protein ACLRGF_02290 [Mycetocola zhadangensis]|uniref:hypothetical protein n=1 Tax=Mycetocola zhadangensis TaxID=1164595 RepID=UPI003A4D588B
MTLPEESAEILHRIASALEPDGPIEVGTMFRSPGLRTNGKIVAFLGSAQSLIVKLPHDCASALVDAGDAEPVTMGSRTMREWISIPAAPDAAGTEALWTSFAREAFDYVRTLAD